MVDGKVGAGLRAAPAGSLVVTPTITQHHPLLQFIHQQATRTTVQSPVITHAGGMVGIKTKAPPQILPKPAGKTAQVTATAAMATTMATVPTPTAVPVQAIAHTQPSQALLLNQMVANGAVLVQQQTSSGLQLILKSTAPTQPKPGPGLVIANGSPLPQTLILQGRTQAHQVVRLVPGQMQVQQVQTAAGPALIAVPTAVPSTAVPTINAISTPVSPLHKKIKKKKKREEEPPRLDLANLIKISGIEDDEAMQHNGEIISSNHQHSGHHSQQAKVICSKQQNLHQQQHHHHHQQQQIHQTHTKQQSTHHIITSSPQSHQPSSSPQLSGAGLRLSVGEDGTMVVHQAEQGGVSASVAAAAQTQLAQLIADHGGHILQTGSVYGRAQRAGSVVVAPGQNGSVRVMEAAPTPASTADRLILSPAPIIDPGRLILTGVPTSSGISVEQQQNRIIVSSSTGNSRLMTAQSTKVPMGGSRVIVQNTEEGRMRVGSAEGRLVVSPADGRLHLVQSDGQLTAASTEQRIRVVSGGGTEGRIVVSPADGKLHLVQAEPPQQSLDQRVRESRLVVSPADGRLHLVQADPPTPPSDMRPPATPVSPSDTKIHLVQTDTQPQQHPDQRIRVVGTAAESRLVMSPSDGRLHIVQNDLPPPDPPPPDTRIQYVGKEFANRPDLTVLPGKPPPPQPQPPRPSSFDNPVIDSIAQAHPSLVINKSTGQTEAQTQAQPTRVIKMKKPAKKAALVKPMMAEDRDRSPPPSPHHPRLPTLQLQPHKQQQLKEIQAQISALNNSGNKGRNDGQVLLQRLVNEQHKILVSGKVVQHGTNSTVNAQPHTMVSSSTNTVSRCNSRSNGIASPPTHANKATSPIHIQVCNSSSPSPPLGNGAAVNTQSQQTTHQSHNQQQVLSHHSHHHHQQVTNNHQHQQQQQVVVREHHQQQVAATQHHHPQITSHHPQVVREHHHHQQQQTVTQQQQTVTQQHQQVVREQHHHQQQQVSPTQSHPQVVVSTQQHQVNSQPLQQLPTHHSVVTLQQHTQISPKQPPSHHHQQVSHHQTISTHQQTPCIQQQSHPSHQPPQVSSCLQQTHLHPQQVTSCQQAPASNVHTSTPTQTQVRQPVSPAVINQGPQVQTTVTVKTEQKDSYSLTKRASLFEDQWLIDRGTAIKPDVSTPFIGRHDAVRRLIAYHTLDEPLLSSRDLAKADELFEQTAKHLLDKKQTLFNKYSNLILRESMRMQSTSELVLLGRLFVTDESSTLDQLKQDALELEKQPPTYNCISNKKDDVYPSGSNKRDEFCNGSLSSKRDESSTCVTNKKEDYSLSSLSAVKRERDDSSGTNEKEVKKHCPDDEEINAQVQSAIDSILNLQRGDLKPTPPS